MGRDTLTRPYIVLGRHKPPVWNPRKVGKYITNLTAELGLTPLRDKKQKTQFTAPWYSRALSAEVRKRTPMNNRAEGWHQDGDLDDGAEMDHVLILWSSNTPVEIRADDEIFIPKPYEIIAVSNLSCFHRRPPYANRVRWRFRQKIKNDSQAKKVLDKRVKV